MPARAMFLQHDKFMAWIGHFRTKDIFHMFVSLTWLSGLIYYMLGQLIDTHQSASTPRHINSEGPVPGHTENVQSLEQLGFVSEPKSFPDDYSREDNLPVFVLIVEKHQVDDLYDFLGSFKLHFSGKKLIIYNLGLQLEDIEVIKSSCQCQIREVQWDMYPMHVRNRQHFHAYRPILIQESLEEFGMVFWCDVAMRFVSSDLAPYIRQAELHGIVTWWHQQYPTSALTHHNMFRYFNTNSTDYYFHRVAHPNRALIVNTKHIHTRIMSPWIRCCLDIECIAPRGSQPGGCNYMHKPKYIYAGCHHYDTSAFNIVLGQMFNMETPYMGSNKLFFTVDNT